jgi:hypothetical protein
MRIPLTIVTLLILAQTASLLAVDSTSDSQPLPAQISYNRDIRPILSSKCFQCHGFDAATREADLRLDIEASSRDAIEPGDHESSELFLRMNSEDPDELMPPPEIHKPTTPRERQLIARWIEQGAEYEAHWVYEPIAKEQSESATIDSLMQERWAAETGERPITPAAPATPRTLLRRLSLDLRGLPPTPEEVATFAADPSPRRYTEFVDRYLGSLEYAENQAARWLDLVRFSDTTGLVSDEPIATGLYRKYVVDSFHKNQPFDQFTIEQLAGDLLDNPTDEQLIASAYNRLIKTNCEAGVIDDEALYAMKGEHARGVGAVWLSATTGCAECHDHKFDPITAKDYYSLAAFFDDLIEVGVYTPGDRRVPIHFVHASADASARDRELEKQCEQIAADIEQSPIDEEQLAAWKSETVARLKDHQTRDRFVWIDSVDTTAMVQDGEYETTQFNESPARQTHSTGELVTHSIAETATGFWEPGKVKSHDADGKLFVDVSWEKENRPTTLVVQVIAGAYGRVGWKPNEFQTFVWGDESKIDAIKSQLPPAAKTISMGELPGESASDAWQQLEIPYNKFSLSYPAVGLRFGHIGGIVRWGDAGLDCVVSTATELRLAETLVRRWWNTPHYRMTFEDRMKVMREVLLGTAGYDADLQDAWTRAAYNQSRQVEAMTGLRSLQAELHRLRADAKTVVVSKAGTPKTTRVLVRGNFMDTTGAITEPAIPEFMGKLDTGERRATRLDLARWIVSNDNPITARVYVNRVWAQLFGHGISRTLEDSGGQGDWPSHPDLLDFLASEFRSGGWDRKALMRMIVLSEAYQRSSAPNDELRSVDPANDLFARQSRFRLRGEQIRDAALVVSGLYQPTREVPTESFFPYQSDVYWQRSSKIMYGSRHMIWKPSAGTQQHQRTLYAFWKRQNIHPTLLAMDAPTRQECAPDRTQTNTPGQALALLNDPIFLDAAIGLADRTLDAVASVDNRNDHHYLEQMFQFALQRSPTAEETDALMEFVTEQREHYESNRAHANELLAIAIHRTPVAKQSASAVIERAAWTMAARVLLNTHEFITRD